MDTISIVISPVTNRAVRVGSCRLYAIVVCAFLAMQIHAAVAAPSKDVRVDLFLTSGTSAEFALNGSTLKFGIGEAANVPTITLGPGRQVQFWINDYNPLLYSYSATVESKPSPDAAALQTFETALEKFAAAGGPLAAAVAPVQCTLNDVPVGDLQTRLADLYTAARSDIPKYFSSLATLENPGLATAAQKDALELRSKLANAPSVDSALKKLDSMRLLQVSGAPLTLTGCNLAAPISGTSFAGLVAQAHAINPAVEQLVQFLSTLAEVSRDTSTTIELMQKVADTLATVGKPYELKSVEFDAAINDTVTVTVKANAGFSPYSDGVKSVVDKHLGTYKIPVIPREHWHPQISAAAIYSFVKNPQYSASSNASGQLSINQTSNDVTKLSGAVALNLTPDAWYGELVAPHFQVGIVPNSTNPAILAGIGITAAKYFDFNVGAIYQKVTELGAGLSVGQVISTTQALKTSTSYKSGFYIGIGVKLK